MKDQILILFNLSSDLDDPIFTSSVAWVVELSTRFNQVIVYSVHLGRVPTIKNVTWRQIGGGNFSKRIRGVYRLTAATYAAFANRKSIVIFHYMNHKTLVYPGIIFRLMGVRQILWYAHASKTLMLYIAEKIAITIVTSSKTAFPIRSKKIIEIGQALTVNVKEFAVPIWKERISGIVSLARVSKAKYLENAILGIALSNFKNASFSNIGPINDLKYQEQLLKFAKQNSVTCVFENAMTQHDALNKIGQYKYYYSGTAKAVDKAAVEAAGLGCLIITTNINLQEMLGLDNEFRNRGIEFNIAKQIDWYMSLPDNESSLLSDRIKDEVHRNLSLISVVSRLEKVLRGL